MGRGAAVCILLAGLAAPFARAAALPEGLKKVEGPLEASVYRDPDAPAYVRMPPGYHWTAPKNGRGVHYGYAFHHDTDNFELRFHFSTLTNARTFDGPPKKGEVRADLDAPTPAIAEAVQTDMGAAERTEFMPFPPDGVRSEFAADWGYTTGPFALDPKHPFTDGYRYAILHFVHRNGVGNYVLMLMSDDADTLIRRSQSDLLLYSVRFEDPKDRRSRTGGLLCPKGSELKGRPFPVGRVLACMRAGTFVAQGPFIQTHAGGAPELRGSYKDGKPDGEAETFDYLGRLMNRRSFRGGKVHGLSTDFYPGGAKAAQSDWEDGKQAGAARFFDEKGRPTDQAGVAAAMERLARERAPVRR